MCGWVEAYLCLTSAAVSDDEFDVGQGIDIKQRVAIDDDDIGNHSRFHGAETPCLADTKHIAATVEDLCVCLGRCGNHLRWCHAAIHKSGHLAPHGLGMKVQPYALTVGGAAILFGSIMTALGSPWWLGIGIGLVVLWLILRFYGKPSYQESAST